MERENYNRNATFKYSEANVEIVYHFKYLGILFIFNGKFKNCKKHIYAQVRKVIFSLLSKFKKFKLSLETQLELFDKTIVPILTYGSELCCFEKQSILESLHLKDAGS